MVALLNEKETRVEEVVGKHEGRNVEKRDKDTGARSSSGHSRDGDGATLTKQTQMNVEQVHKASNALPVDGQARGLYRPMAAREVQRVCTA